MTDVPLIEYLIIGTHTSVWMMLIFAKIFGLSISDVASVDPALLVIYLPFIYLIGMLFDYFSFQPLDYFRKKIREKIYDAEVYKDEFITYYSSDLYDAYETRVRRVRVLGASIFNWPLVGGALLLHFGIENRGIFVSIVVTAVLLSILSAISWRGLYQRAYKFRKNACDVIFSEQKKLMPKAKSRPKAKK